MIQMNLALITQIQMRIAKKKIMMMSLTYLLWKRIMLNKMTMTVTSLHQDQTNQEIKQIWMKQMIRKIFMPILN